VARVRIEIPSARAETSAHVRSRSACSSRHAARETRASTRRSRRAAPIRSLIVTRPACQPRSGNWTPYRCSRLDCYRYPELRERGVGLVVLKQHIDTTTPTGRLVFHILGAIDEFQRELIIEGTREGLDAARARGRTGGRKPKLNARQAATVRRMYEAVGPDGKRQHTVAEIAEAVGVHRTTVYDYLNKEG